MISMIACRDELYSRLLADYRSNKENSFFYRYMKSRKDAHAQRISESSCALEEYRKRKKPDKYVLLRAFYLAYKSALVTEEVYIHRFVEIAGIQKRSKNEPLTEDINARFFEIIGAKKRRMHKEITLELIDEVEQAYELAFLKGCISDCFINMGYRIRKAEEMQLDEGDRGYVKKSEKYKKEKDGYISDLDLWAEYYYDSLAKGEQQYIPRFVSELTDDYIRKCDSLFGRLNENQKQSDQTLNENQKQPDRSKTFIPLYHDSFCGASVTIIGNDMLPPDKKSDNACRLCIMYFSEPGEEISDWDDIPITMMTELYDDVYEAFARFKEGIATLEYTVNYRDQNGKCPDKIDDVFSGFFLEKEQKAAPNAVIRKRAEQESKQMEKWKQENAANFARTGVLSR